MTDKDFLKSSKQNDLEASQPDKKPIKRLLTPLLPKKVPTIPEEFARKPLPIFSVNFFSQIFYSWLLVMLSVGYKRTLTQNDLWNLHGELSIDEAYKRFCLNLERRVNGRDKFPRFAVPLSIFDSFKLKFILAVIFKILSTIAQCFTPFLIKYLVKSIEDRINDPKISLSKGSGFAVGITLLISAQSILLNQSLLLSNYIGAQARTILTKSLLEKSLTANAGTRNKFPNGSIISFLGSDLSRIDNGIGQLPFAFAVPFPIIIGIALLIINVKVSAVVGIATIFVFLGLLALPLSFYTGFRNKSNIYTDKRVSLTREVVQSIKFIKFYAWEDAYKKMIINLRNKESSLVLKMQFLVAIFFTVIVSLYSFTPMAVFLTLYGIKGLDSSSPIIFSSLALINMMTDNIIELPLVLSKAIDGFISFKRISKYLESPDEENIEEHFSNEIIKDENIAIKISDAEFRYESFPEVVDKSNSDEKLNDSIKSVKESSVLKNVNIEIKKGEFIMITGATGSGKSSLLASMFGLISKKSGTVAINGSSLFCNIPWIQNTTIRENIIFGSDYEPNRYRKVIDACALSNDFKSFPAGDLTEIGERGVTLSGGQKSRINIARAIYADKEILVFDDILNAVDAKVGESIMSKLFLDLIKHKTRILTTHQLSVLNYADRIIFLNGDGTITVGTKDELIRENSKFKSLINQFVNESDERLKNSRSASKDGDTEAEKRSEGRLVQDEERAVNAIPISIYHKYLQSGQGLLGPFAIPSLIILIVLSTFTGLFTNVWLTYWIDLAFSKLKNNQYIAIYITLNIVSVIIYCLQFALTGYIIVKSSKKLTILSIIRMLHIPMKFYDTTPIGRILNRFSKDVNSLDNEIGESLQFFLYQIGLAIGVLIVAIVCVPYFAIALPMILLIALIIISFYQASAREVKRLEAINRSFILNNFNEVLTGLSTIKLYKAQKRFIARNDFYVDKLNEVYFVVIANQRWISVNLTLSACLLSFILLMLIVSRQFNISAATAGLLTTYMLNFTDLLTNSLTVYSELENQMNSVERIMHYAYNLDQEPPYRIMGTQPEKSWPLKGDIQFKNASFRYRDGLPLILKTFSCCIKGGERIGICGRTGAGKSSLLNTLYRLGELSSGKILIDNVDISTIGLFDLRSKLSIIPQDPVLFQGTLKQNLDPFGERTDDELWDALRKANLLQERNLKYLKSQVKENYDKFHLESKVEEGGSNFSLGECQLIALARALVRKTKILIMDEATSSVDYETDNIIQNTISTEFEDCTVLCIAHRLKTIINFDKILVLDRGNLVQFGIPKKLFEDELGLFREMCDLSNIGLESF
ncbi:hypothetical protein WICMUC_002738 [Wickerhamomyces mucosus]|uniref:Oligomycin resistance ATP-dependent permease YOR1 n=1 Tax=Wickerhamomyces mucosus TaxID=1378264 RepID=A0A9P8PQF0_9ASCO|nr:hypothetical protein WICMUC_002738 [Wickerhamomyces mucosus]